MGIEPIAYPAVASYGTKIFININDLQKLHQADLPQFAVICHRMVNFWWTLLLFFVDFPVVFNDGFKLADVAF